MKKHLLSFILMVAGAGGAYAAEPVQGILCSYAGHVAFFPLSDSPSVKYVDKSGEQNAVVMVGGAEKMSVALIDGGKLEVSYDSRTLSEYTVSAKITASGQPDTSGNQVLKAAEGKDGDVLLTFPAAAVGNYAMAEQTIKVKFDAEGNISMVDGQTVDFTGTQDVVVTVTSVTGTIAEGQLNLTIEGEGSNGIDVAFAYTSAASHEHDYATSWSSDATNHWHACTGGECDAKSDEAAHSYGQVTTQTTYYTCSVCQYVNTTRQNEYNSAVQAAADQAAATNVTNMINSIGTVVYTTECNGKITSARAAYDNLTAGQKSLVSNLQTLTDAEAAYADLKAAAEAVTKINAIGTVEHTEASKALIDDARAAYDALTDDQKAIVTNAQLQVLTDAEAAYADLKAADEVVTKINAIGTVEHTEASKTLIDDARAAYDALTATQKTIVTEVQLQVLTDAEAEYARLKAIDDVEDVIAAIGEVEYTEEGKDECWAKIDAARQAYDALPCVTDQAEVENYQTLLDAEAEWDRLIAALLKSTLVVTESKWATFVAPYAVNLPKGVTAYTIPGVESNKATLIMKEVEGKLPANTPVVIYSDEPVVKEYVLPFIVGIPQEGIMVGVLVNTDIRSGYVLQNQNDLVGFYQVNGVRTIPANRAYIAQSASTDGIDDDRVKAYFFDTATAIKALDAMADGKAEIYDMNGRKQSRLQKGINIVNGVKVLVK